jgi:hypothetical protein
MSTPMGVDKGQIAEMALQAHDKYALECTGVNINIDGLRKEEHMNKEVTLAHLQRMRAHKTPEEVDQGIMGKELVTEVVTDRSGTQKHQAVKTPPPA